MTEPMPPPGLIAAAEQDYHHIREVLNTAILGARLILTGRGTEVEAFTDVYTLLRDRDPATAAALGAAVITQLALNTPTTPHPPPQPAQPPTP